MSEPGIHAVPSANDPFAGPDSLFNRLEGWTWIGCYGGYYLSSDLLAEAGFEQGFFTRRWQGRAGCADHLSLGWCHCPSSETGAWQHCSQRLKGR